MVAQGFGRIMRAGGVKPATAGRAKNRGEGRRDQPLVDPDEPKQNPSGEAGDLGEELRHGVQVEV